MYYLRVGLSGGYILSFIPISVLIFGSHSFKLSGLEDLESFNLEDFLIVDEHRVGCVLVEIRGIVITFSLLFLIFS